MLICRWYCSCGWEGPTEELKEDKNGHKVCPRCNKKEGLE